jgi:hypothetical protein
LKGNPHRAQPQFDLEVTWEEALAPGGKKLLIEGGADLFVVVEVIPDLPLSTRLEESLILDKKQKGTRRAVYVVGRK